MANVLILLVSMLVLGLSGFLFWKASGTLSVFRLNLVNLVFYRDFLILSFVGAVLSAMGLCNGFLDYQQVSHSSLVFAWAATLYAMVMTPVAMLVLGLLGGIGQQSAFANYCQAPVEYPERPALYRCYSFLILLLALAGVAYLCMASEYIPIRTAMQGDFQRAAQERILTKYGFSGNQYIKNLFCLFLIPSLNYVQYVLARQQKGRFLWLCFATTLAMSSFLLVFDTQKVPLAFFLSGFLVVETLINQTVPKRMFLMLGSISGAALVGAFLVIRGLSFLDLFRLDNPIITRIFLSQYKGTPLSFEWFPGEKTGDLLFAGLPTFILNRFSIEPSSAARIIMERLHPDRVADGTAGLSNSLFLYEAWANYGMIGLLLSPFVVGFAVYALHVGLLRMRKEPHIIAIYAYLAVRWSITGGFTPYLFGKQLLYGIAMLLVARGLFRACRIFMRMFV